MTVHASFGTPADTLASLTAALAPHGSALLRFCYDGHETTPGYHVTEVKRAAFASLDCGANPESWSETVIQLWDIHGGEGQITVGKFLAILRKVQRDVGLEESSPVIFEIGGSGEAMRLYSGGQVQVTGDDVLVTLSPRHASCKPRDRWLEAEPAAPASACCGSQPSTGAACCG
jgi:hypothetical protein